MKDYKVPILYVLSLRNSLYEDFDIGDNPYIDVHANIEIDSEEPIPDENTILKKCSEEELAEVFTEGEVYIYE